MRRISLDGAWEMRSCKEEAWHAATVPGSVYSDLLQDGLMEDPFYRENEREAFELLRQDWEYRRSFTLSQEEQGAGRIQLCCEGLDTLAHVWLNGHEVGYADNMHITWRWDVKELLQAGDNEILIRFDSPIEYALREYEKRPGWCSTDAIPGFAHIRKAHCMFGWDWGPRLPDAGIWRSICLELTEGVRIDSVLILQEHRIRESGETEVVLTITPQLEGEADYWTVRVTSPDAKTLFAQEQGESTCLSIDEPRLWWPAGYGDQPLYEVEVKIFRGDSKEAQDTWTRRIGLRTLSVSRQKDEAGEEFCHICNGVKIFAMGADYIPEDNILSRTNPQRTRRLLEDARLAHYNSVRIWGGGYYPADSFYDICDELGLLVWQDLMYACAFYDLTPAFEASIREETRQNIRRLRHHASLALVCGNNEMEQFMGEALQTTMQGDDVTNGPKRFSHYADYIKMFEYVLPSIVKEEAPQTFWWPASPSSGGNFDHPQDPSRGDVHYWDVWHGEKPFTEYRKFLFRYVSEFGFQSFPCLATVESFTLPEDRNVFSRIMERHQRNAAANGKILSYLSQTFLYPTSFDNLLYASQLLQAEAIRYGVEHWRRNRGTCMGAIVWQLNDCWPVASWASIDYYGRWKALHYAEKRFFAPVLLSCQEEGELSQNPRINEFHPLPIETSARLNVSNESRERVRGKVCWALRTPDAGIVREGSFEVEVPGLAAVWLPRLEFADCSVTGHYFSYRLEREDGSEAGSGSVLFCAPKHFRFLDPQLQVRKEGDELVVTAAAYARSVCLESEDPDLLLEDNYFDMNAGEKRVKLLRGKAESPRARSVFDIR